MKISVLFLIFFTACTANTDRDKQQQLIDHEIDSTTEASIDSAYKKIKQDCDTAIKYTVPVFADSVFKMLKDSSPAKLTDSVIYKRSILLTGADTSAVTIDSLGKAANVIRVLKADCNTSLLKETYKQARQKLLSKPRHSTSKKSRHV